MPKKYKLLLINPANMRRRGISLMQGRIFPPMSLGIIGALTPPNWEVEILDENFTPFEYQDADLVAITSLTVTINRAYEIATEYRKNKIPVVIGGIHASMLPEEASKYVDTVAIGEAEGIWEQIISDYENNRLQRFYRAELPKMVKSPRPRMDLYHPGYNFSTMQTSRGCPMKCEFCSVHTFNGSKYRLRQIDKSVDDFAATDRDMVFIIDDNIIGYNKEAHEHALGFFKEIIRRGVQKDWLGMASMNIGEDENLLKHAAESGCTMIFVGVESERIDQLEQMNKMANLKVGVDHYADVFKTIHKYGLAIMGAFIYGLDEDTPDSMHKRTSYIVDSDVDTIQATILTPLPGTLLYKRFKEEGRLLYNNYPEDWERFGFGELVFRPKKMSPAEFDDAMYEGWERMYSLDTIKRKFLNTLKSTKNPTAAVWGLNSNLQLRNFVFEGKKETLDPDSAFPGLLDRLKIR